MTHATEEAKKKLLEYPFVTAVGHGQGRGERHKNDEKALVAFVTVKKPESELDPEDVLPKEIEGVKVDVQEVGTLGIEPVKPDAVQDTGEIDTTSKHRPAPQGVSIGHPEITAGTAGLIMWKETEKFGMTIPEPVGVTNNHVAANENKADKGDKILQPGPYDGGRNRDTDIIGHLEDYVEIEDTDNTVDLAWYSLDGRNMVSFIPSIGVPTEKAQVSEQDVVKKFGRTTGNRKGKVLTTDARVKVNYDTGAKAFTDQIITESISSGGDSGSAVVNELDEAVGILFAGSSKVSVVNKIDNVLEESGLHLNPKNVYGGEH